MVEPVLEVRGLSVVYESPGGKTQAVSDVSLLLGRGELVGLAGESGCGKSTLALALSRLLPPTGRVTSGQVLFHVGGDGETVDVLGLSGEQLRLFRWRRMSMVFQGAMNGLNPVMVVGRQLADAISAHDSAVSRAALRSRCCELLSMVGVDPRHVRSYPHELSGGMRQRVMLAMALALEPDVVLMDEPTTALDVVVQHEILDQVRALQSELEFAVLFITHDLSLLLDLADRIAVMYAGRIVEEAPVSEFVASPAHPYTAGLLGSFPSLDGPPQELSGIPGSPPDLRHPVVGCAFAPRCPYAEEDCRADLPPLAALGRGDRTASCFHPLVLTLGPSSHDS